MDSSYWRTSSMGYEWGMNSLNEQSEMVFIDLMKLSETQIISTIKASSNMFFWQGISLESMLY